MTVIKLTQEYLEDFFNYCRKHRYAHDESYLYEEDLDEFVVGDDNPTYLLIDNKEIVGALSLIINDYLRSGARSRVRIFHCVQANPDHYKLLMDALERLPEDIKKIELFLPDQLSETRDIFESFGYKYYRTSYMMQRDNAIRPSVDLPEGYNVRTFVYGEDEVHYAKIRNAAFANIKGSEQPISLELTTKLVSEPYVLENSPLVLCHEDRPIGVINMIEDVDDDGKHSSVSPIAILPEYHGKGLGTCLLKAGINVGIDAGYKDCVFCVNAENEKALNLYLKVGFEINAKINCLVLAI